MLGNHYLRLSNEMIRTFYNFGLKIGTFLKERINIGFCDDASSSNAAKYLIKGLTSAGIHVHNNGVITLPHFLSNTQSNGYHSIYVGFKNNPHDSLYCFDGSNKRIMDLTKFEESPGKKVSDCIGFQVMQRDNGDFLSKYESLITEYPKTLWTAASTIVSHTTYKLFHKFNWEFLPFEGAQKMIARILQTRPSVGIIFDAIGEEVRFIDSGGRLIDPDMVAMLLMSIIKPKQVHLDSHASKPVHLFCKDNGIKIRGYVDNIWQNDEMSFGYNNHAYAIDGTVDAFLVSCLVLQGLANEKALKELTEQYKIYKWRSDINILKTAPSNFSMEARTQQTQHYFEKNVRLTITADKYITAEAADWELLNHLRQQLCT